MAYAGKNEVCHTEVGNPSFAGDSYRFDRVIKADKAALPQIRPKTRVD